MSFFHILHEVYICKQEVVVIDIPEWKLKAELARNTVYIWRKLGQNFYPVFWVKNSKKLLF